MRRLAIPMFLVVFTALLCGCKTNRVSSQESADASAYWQPHQLLISGERHARLHVEIDALEGLEPNETEIASLKEFLTRYTRKPGGITIAIDDVIPREDASGKLSRVLALEHMDGVTEPDAAFLYYLFYDSKISPEKKSQPVCLLSPYPGAILVDHQYVKTRSKRLADFRRRILLHETAHALGLCRNSHHSDGLHCTNKDCLMNPTLYVSVSRFILGRDPIRQKDFCEHCQQDFQSNLATAPPANLHYHGPYMIRSEADYQVISRPNLVYVHIGPRNTISWKEIEDLRKQAAADTQNKWDIHYGANSVNRAVVAAAVPKLLEDPVKTVRDIGKKFADKLGAEGSPEGEPK